MAPRQKAESLPYRSITRRGATRNSSEGCTYSLAVCSWRSIWSKASYRAVNGAKQRAIWRATKTSMSAKVGEVGISGKDRNENKEKCRGTDSIQHGFRRLPPADSDTKLPVYGCIWAGCRRRCCQNGSQSEDSIKLRDPFSPPAPWTPRRTPRPFLPPWQHVGVDVSVVDTLE